MGERDLLAESAARLPGNAFYYPELACERGAREIFRALSRETTAALAEQADAATLRTYERILAARLQKRQLHFVAAHGNSQLRRPLATEEGERISQNYLLDGLQLNFLAEEVAGDFCDASSPLSLAGYMNGEFL